MEKLTHGNRDEDVQNLFAGVSVWVYLTYLLHETTY